MNKKKAAALFLTAALAAGSLAGCSSSVPGKVVFGKSAPEQVFRFSLLTEPPTLDPQIDNSMISSTVDNELFEGLLRNDNGKIESAGASSYTMSKDGKTYTFKLNQKAKWSDGKAVVADDYVYGLQRLMDPKTASPYAFAGEILKNGVAVETGKKPVSQLGVKALDKYTVQIQLENPCAYFTQEVATDSYAPARRDLSEKYGKKYNSDPSYSVYNGPFKLQTWLHNNKLVLVKNDAYWNKSIVKLNEVDISVISDSNTALGLYESGQLDFVELSNDVAANYKNAKSYSSGSVNYLEFNMKASKVLANKDFRLAVSYALDRSNYVKLALGGNDKPATRFVLPDVNSYKNGVSYGSMYKYSPFSTKSNASKAKTYLNKALKELGLKKPSDITINFGCVDRAGDTKCAEVVQSQLQTVLGIKTPIKQYPYKQYYQNLSANNYEMDYTGWSPDYADPNTFLDFWATNGAYNHAFYNNKTYDKLIADAGKTVDPKKRMDLLFKAEKQFCSDVVACPLSLTQKKYLISSKVKNFGLYFIGYTYNFTRTSIS
jgi:ABC-type oligopeptide transport system, periplasmic component